MKKSKGLQLGAMFMALLLFSMAFVPAVSAQGAPENKDKKIIEIKQLQPEAGSEVILDSLQAIEWSDGSVTISGSGKKQVGAPAQYFHWEVNISKGTYKTTKLTTAELKETIPIITKIEKNNGKYNSDVSAAVAPGQYTATVLVVTDDPLGEDLAKTTQQLTWTINNDGTVDSNWRSASCWAANPSSQDTHWFVDTCNFFGSITYSSDRTSLFSEVKSKFHNWDWGIDSWATYAEHWSKIQGRNDSWYNYWWDATHSGEDWFLLDGDVYAS